MRFKGSPEGIKSVPVGGSFQGTLLLSSGLPRRTTRRKNGPYSILILLPTLQVQNLPGRALGAACEPAQ